MRCLTCSNDELLQLLSDVTFPDKGSPPFLRAPPSFPPFFGKVESFHSETSLRGDFAPFGLKVSPLPPPFPEDIEESVLGSEPFLFDSFAALDCRVFHLSSRASS